MLLPQLTQLRLGPGGFVECCITQVPARHTLFGVRELGGGLEQLGVHFAQGYALALVDTFLAPAALVASVVIRSELKKAPNTCMHTAKREGSDTSQHACSCRKRAWHIARATQRGCGAPGPLALQVQCALQINASRNVTMDQASHGWRIREAVTVRTNHSFDTPNLLATRETIV